MDRVPLFTRPNPDYEAAYDVFHKQGASRILWGEISKILCSWFLVIYTMVITLDTSGNLQTWAVGNAVVISCLTLWSSFASAAYVKKSWNGDAALRDVAADFRNESWDDIARRLEGNDSTRIFYEFCITRKTRPIRKTLLCLNQGGTITGTERWFTNYFKWALQMCLSYNLPPLPHDIEQIMDESIVLDSRETDKKIIRSIIIMTVMAPFFLFFNLSHLLIKTFCRIKAQPTSLFSREWTPLAKIVLRGENELPHRFDKRLASIKHLIIQHIKSKPPNPAIEAFAKIMSFISGTLLLTLVAPVAIHPSVLASLVTEEAEIVWIIAILSTVIATLHFERDVPPLTPKQHKFIQSTTSGLSIHVLQRLLKPKFEIIAMELVSVFTTPWNLWHKIKPNVKLIENFLNFSTMHADCAFEEMESKGNSGISDDDLFDLSDDEHDSNGENQFNHYNQFATVTTVTTDTSDTSDNTF